MAPLTYYVVLPFFRPAEGELAADEAIEAPSANAARTRAERVAGGKGGAVAFSRRGDPMLGEFDDAVILAKFGDVPDDLASFTGPT